jgi:hypothetical protein
VSKEAGLRERDEVLPDIRQYVAFRREAGGLKAAFDLVEYSLGIDLPPYVHEDPVFISGYNAAIDVVFLANVCFNLSLQVFLTPWSNLFTSRIYSHTTRNKQRDMAARTRSQSS